MKKNYERVRCSIVLCGAVDVICSSDNDVGGAWNNNWFSPEEGNI